MTVMPSSRIATSKPMLLMTVETTVSSGSVPAAFMCAAQIAMIDVAVDLVAGLVDGEHAVGVAVVRDAEVDLAARDELATSGPRCVEPQPTLMSMPSQSQLIAMTSAPSRRSASGVATDAAP